MSKRILNIYDIYNGFTENDFWTNLFPYTLTKHIDKTNPYTLNHLQHMDLITHIKLISPYREDVEIHLPPVLSDIVLSYCDVRIVFSNNGCVIERRYYPYMTEIPLLISIVAIPFTQLDISSDEPCSCNTRKNPKNKRI